MIFFGKRCRYCGRKMLKMKNIGRALGVKVWICANASCKHTERTSR